LLSSEYNKEDIRTTTNQSSCKIDALNLSSFLFDDIGPITSWSFPFPIWIKSLGVLKIQEKLNKDLLGWIERYAYAFFMIVLAATSKLK
jgi:hypothetical protein